MIKLKTPAEIAIMAEGGKRLRKVVTALKKKIKVGITTAAIDKEAERLIEEQRGQASFKKVAGYHFATCLPINEQVVHTPPANRIVKEGDVLTLDIGMYYRGFHTDFADTFLVGKSNNTKIGHFLNVGRQTLYKAIAAAKVGNRIGMISNVIEKEIYNHGFFVLKELTGHGIGHDLHEEPFIFGYNEAPVNKTPVIKSGLTIAIEVIYSMGTENIAYEEGVDWSVVTADGSLSACFEHTVAITAKNTFILT